MRPGRAEDLKRTLASLLADHRALEAAFAPLRRMAPAGETATPSRDFRSAWGAVLFADLVGFTRITGAAAPELVGRLLSEFFSAMRAVVEGAHGNVVLYIGDCVLAVFVAEEPHGAVANAIGACARMHEEVGTIAARLALPLTLRIGMNAGDFLLGPIDDGTGYLLSVLGETVNVASKAETVGRPGRTSVTAAVVRLLPVEWTAGPARDVTTAAGRRFELFELERAEE